MNSSLPDFSSNPSAAAAGAANPLFNTDALAGLVLGGMPGSTGGALPADFSDLMAETEAPVPVGPTTTVQAVATTPAVVTMAAPSRRFTTEASASVLTGEAPAPIAGGIATESALAFTGKPVRTSEGVETESDTPLVSLVGEEPVTTSSDVPEEVREQAVAFVVSLFQTLLPEATQVTVASDMQSAFRKKGSPAEEQPQPSSPGEPAGMPAAEPVLRDTTSVFPPQANRADAEIAAKTWPDASRSPALTAQVAPLAQAGMTVAPDGAVEVSVTLPARKPDAALPAGETQAGASDESQPMSIEAELVIPGQPVVRLHAQGFARPDAADPMSPGRPENFAARFRPTQAGAGEEKQPIELNFESASAQEVETAASPAGIGVAQSEPTMSAAPTEDIRSARQPHDPTVLPARADFQVAQTPVERITTAAPEPTGQSFAGRAVETVTNLAEAQFSVSMQRSGSVQLRLQFGGEDLSVRVAIRDGAVHADFRTDSAPLRAALEQEWQAVKAASPEHLQRFAEPVFSPASGGEPRASSGQGDQPQQHARSQQSPADPDAQSQHQRPAREPAAASFFSRRSLVPETFVPEPAAARAAAFLPTSLRLSALA